MSELAAFCFVNCLIVLFIRYVGGAADVLVYAAYWGGAGLLVVLVGRAVGGRRVA